MHPSTSAEGRWNIPLHQSCTGYLTSSCWTQGLPCLETEGAPWGRWKEVLVYWVFRKTCPANNQTCLTVSLGTCRLNCKRKLLKDASSILTCYIAIMLHLTPAVLKKGRVLKGGGSSAQGIVLGQEIPFSLPHVPRHLPVVTVFSGSHVLRHVAKAIFSSWLSLQIRAQHQVTRVHQVSMSQLRQGSAHSNAR